MSSNAKTTIYVILCAIFTFSWYFLQVLNPFSGTGGPAGAAIVIVFIIPAFIAIFLTGIIIVVGIYRKPKQRLIILCLITIIPLVIEVGRSVLSSIERSQGNLYAYHLRELDKEYEQAWKELQTPSKVEQVMEKAKEKIGISDRINISITQNNAALLMGLGMKHPDYQVKYMSAVESNRNLSCRSSKILAENYLPSIENEFIWLFERLHDVDFDEPAESCLRYSNSDDFSYKRMIELGFLKAAQLRLGLSDIQHEDIFDALELTQTVENKQHRKRLMIGILERADIFRRNRIFNTLYYANQSILFLQDDPDLPTYVEVLRMRLLETSKTVVEPLEKWKFDTSQRDLFKYMDVLELRKGNAKYLEGYFDAFPPFLTEYYQQQIAERENYDGPSEILFRSFIWTPPVRFEDHRPYVDEPYTISFKGEVLDRGTTNEYGCFWYVLQNVQPGDYVTITAPALGQEWVAPVGAHLKLDDPNIVSYYLKSRGYNGYYHRTREQTEGAEERVIKNFQHAQNIEETGVLDEKTVIAVKKSYFEIYSDQYCN